jgi:hypothetical protein
LSESFISSICCQIGSIRFFSLGFRLAFVLLESIFKELTSIVFFVFT